MFKVAQIIQAARYGNLSYIIFYWGGVFRYDYGYEGVALKPHIYTAVKTMICDGFFDAYPCMIRITHREIRAPAWRIIEYLVHIW